jgi:hypothetical protein
VDPFEIGIGPLENGIAISNHKDLAAFRFPSMKEDGHIYFWGVFGNSHALWLVSVGTKKRVMRCSGGFALWHAHVLKHFQCKHDNNA